jgi:threonine dehydratase
MPTDAPTGADLTTAKTLLDGRDVRSPSQLARRLSNECGRDIWVKYESFSPIGSFKIRGAICAVHAAKRRGATSITTASTGNHGQGIALAAAAAGLPATVFMPEGVDPLKQRKMRDLGATTEVGGPRLVDAEAAAARLAERTGGEYIEDGENPDLMAGAATIGLEILDQVPGVDTIITPIGGGNLAAGICLAMAHADSPVRVIGVQSSAASGVTASWLQGAMLSRECSTIAGGLATERPGRLSLEVLIERLDGICVVTEDDLWAALAFAYDRLGHNLELAAVAPLAALERFGTQIEGERIAVVASGSCIGGEQLSWALDGRSRADWLARTAPAVN